MSKKINVHYVIFLIAIMFFFKPYYFTYFEISVANFVYVYGLRLVFLLALFIYIYEKKLSKFIALMLFFYLTKFISTIINSGSILRLITEIYPALGICLLIEIGLRKNPKQFVKAFATVLSFLTLINFITIIVNPNGYHTIEKLVFFLGNRNQLAPFYILTIVVIKLRNIYFPNKYGKMQIGLVLSICTFMIFHAGSGSNIIAWIPLIFYFIVPFILKKSRIFNIKSYLALYIILFYSVIVYNIQERYADLLYRFLGKDVTFSGRIQLWDIGIEMIKNSPLIGYGMADTSNIIFSPISGKYLSSHNQFIQLMIEGGFVSMLAFASIGYLTLKKLYENKERESSKILSIGIFTIALVLFSEAIGFFYIFILFAFANNIDKIVNSQLISDEN